MIKLLLAIRKRGLIRTLMFKDNQLKFSYLNFDQESFTMYIYNNEGLFFSKNIGKDFSIQKGFGSSGLEEGDYKVVLSSLANEYVYRLVK